MANEKVYHNATSEKLCYVCLKVKPSNLFSKCSGRKGGLAANCKDCAREYGKQWREKNAEKRKIDRALDYAKNSDEYKLKAKSWADANPERKKAVDKAWREKNSERKKDNDRRWKKENAHRRSVNYYLVKKHDPKFMLNSRISNAIRESLCGRKNRKSWKILVPYDLETLRKHLIKTMPIGYTWDDFMQGYLHIDHISPVAAFNFEAPDDADFKKCWSLSNLRFLPASENCSKGAKIDKPFQPSLKGF